MNADSFGYGPCQAPTQYLSCSQAAINEHGLCRWHFKVKFKIAFPYRPETKVVPRDTTKKAVKR